MEWAQNVRITLAGGWAVSKAYNNAAGSRSKATLPSGCPTTVESAKARVIRRKQPGLAQELEVMERVDDTTAPCW